MNLEMAAGTKVFQGRVVAHEQAVHVGKKSVLLNRLNVQGELILEGENAEIADDTALLREDEGVGRHTRGEGFYIRGYKPVKEVHALGASDAYLRTVAEIHHAGPRAHGGNFDMDGSVARGHVPSGLESAEGPARLVACAEREIAHGVPSEGSGDGI